jgi:hypothetical protein
MEFSMSNEWVARGYRWWPRVRNKIWSLLTQADNDVTTTLIGDRYGGLC